MNKVGVMIKDGQLTTEVLTLLKQKNYRPLFLTSTNLMTESPHLIICDEFNANQNHSVLMARKKNSVPIFLPILILIHDKTQVSRYLTQGYDDVLLIEEIPKTLDTRLCVLLNYINNSTLSEYRDSLTGLYNRNYLKVLLTKLLQRAINNKSRTVAVVHIGLDRFKFINNTLGHNIGDLLLQATAQRLRTLIRKHDILARISGDEFSIVLNEIETLEAIFLIGQKILDNLALPFNIEQHEILLTASIGISTYQQDADTAEVLLSKANIALYRAKTKGGNTCQAYLPEMGEDVTNKASLEQDLRQALAKNEFVLYYQPKADLKSGQFIGVEALIRWQHRERGLVSPAEFIPLAEKIGLIVPIGAWVLATACQQAQAWQKNNINIFVGISVNLSLRQIQDEKFLQQVSQTLASTDLEPRYLELELTESVLMEDINISIAVLEALKKLGIQIAIDDFGTGYSSLSYLAQFKVQRIKIDVSFIRNLTDADDTEDAAIVKAIIVMAHSLNIRVIAEGVETKQQIEFLAKHGCDEIQGYYYSHPLRAEEIIPFLESNKKLVM